MSRVKFALRGLAALVFIYTGWLALSIIHWGAESPTTLDVVEGNTKIFLAMERVVTPPDVCVNVEWRIEGVREIYINEWGKVGEGKECVRVDGDLRLTLQTILQDGTDQTYSLGISWVALWRKLSAVIVMLALGIFLLTEHAPILVMDWLTLRKTWKVGYPVRTLMSGWDWLTASEASYTWGFALRVIVKAAALFVVFNLIFALLKPLPALGNLSIYNKLTPGRERFPYSTTQNIYNLEITNLNAFFASHVVSAPKAENEYRVFILGDSAIWGWTLPVENTLAGRLNAAGLTLDDGRQVRVYNLAHPWARLGKDLMLLDYAMRYQPDMVVWLFTAYAVWRPEHLDLPLFQENPDLTFDLIQRLNLELETDAISHPGWLEETIVGRRRELANLLRLQLYGIIWGATGIDHVITYSGASPSNDFGEDVRFRKLEPRPLTRDYLAFEMLQVGISIAGEAPVLLVNEPMFIGDGENSHLWYNYGYPRWMYDDYRAQLNDLADAQDWHLLDLWDALPKTSFSDTPLHLRPEGTKQLSEIIGPAILSLANHEQPEGDE